MLATPLTLYWLKQPAGKFTLPRHTAILPVPQCSTSSFTFFIARGRLPPQRCHCGFCLLLGNSLAFARGSFPGNIGAWHNAMLLLRLPMKSRLAHCAALCDGIFSALVLICFAAQNSCGCRRTKSSSGSKSKTSNPWPAGFARVFLL